MKPVLTFVDHRLQVVAKPRTMRRAAGWLMERLAHDPRRAEQVLVLYADRPEGAIDLADRVGRLLPGVEVDVSPVSYVVGGHTGPGLLGLAVRWRFWTTSFPPPIAQAGDQGCRERDTER